MQREVGVTMHNNNDTFRNTPVQAHPASADVYIRQGWCIIPMPLGSKGPTHAGWNRKENCIIDATALPKDSNYGLAHAYSGTMALDVDDEGLTRAELQKHGIDLDALYDAPDAVTIESGRDGHGKLIYAMPFGLVLPSKKMIQPVAGVRTNYLEFRCATQSGLTVQDVLPPSIHPITQQAYRWAGSGHYARLPQIPQSLLDLWTTLLQADRERNIPTTTEYDTSWDEIRTALRFISPDIDRKEWIDIGMALHFAGSQTGQSDQAFELWNEWSAGSTQDKYKGTKDLANSWYGFNPDGGITLGTLFKLAKDAGWRRPQPTAEEIFGSVDTQDEILDATVGTRAPVPRIDLNQFPKVLATRAEELSQSVGCDALVPLFAGLAAASGVADARIRLELMPGYQVPPVLWVCTLGKPADKKSPGSIPMMEVIRQIEREDLPHFHQRKLEWEVQDKLYNQARNVYIDHFSNSEIEINNEVAPDVPFEPQKPKPLRIVVSDITSQKLGYLTADRPRGLLCWMDEMRGWCKRVTDPRSSDDRSTWTASYESKWHQIDRVNAGEINVDNLAVSIYGNIQPGVFREFASRLSTDGLIQRFIPAILDSERSRLNYPIPDAFSSKALWDQALRLIHALPEQTYRLSQGAYDAYREFQQWYYETKASEQLLDAGDKTQDDYMTAFGKMEGQCGRLCLVMHLIEQPFAPEVSADTMQRAISISKHYIIPSLRYLLGEISGLLEDSVEAWVTHYVLGAAGSVQTITLRDLKRAGRRKIEKLGAMNEHAKNMLFTDAMAWLQQCNWVSLVDSTPTRGHWEWAINPALVTQFQGQREQILKARQQRLDMVRNNISRDTGKPLSRQLVKGYTTDFDERESDAS